MLGLGAKEGSAAERVVLELAVAGQVRAAEVVEVGE